MTRSERIFISIFVLITGVICVGAAFQEQVIKEGAQGFVIGAAIFAFIIGNDMLRSIDD